MSKSTVQAVASTMATCPFCETEFKPERKGRNRDGTPRYQRYCSGDCYNKHQNRQPLVTAICKGCGIEFDARKDRTTYCTRECAFESKQKRCKTCGKAMRGNHGWYCSDDCKPVVWQRVCTVCAVEFLGYFNQIYCSTECKEEIYKPYMKTYHRSYYARHYQPKTRICRECGDQFTTRYRIDSPRVGLRYHGDGRRSFCSKRCSNRYGRRISRATRKARLRGALRYESFDPFEIFKRDKWHCQMCGVKTPKRLRGTLEDNAPELDHIIPVAKGGMHTWANAQCLCRKCNIDKSDQLLGQLRLAIEV